MLEVVPLITHSATDLLFINNLSIVSQPIKARGISQASIRASGDLAPEQIRAIHQLVSIYNNRGYSRTPEGFNPTSLGRRISSHLQLISAYLRYQTETAIFTKDHFWPTAELLYSSKHSKKLRIYFL